MLLYAHTQRSPLKWFFFALTALLLGAAWAVREQPVVGMAISAGALIAGLCGLAFSKMTIKVTDNELMARSGPFPLIATMVRMEDIMEVRPARTSILDGWGLHYFPGRGWTYNVWGRDCIEVITPHRRLRLGTDDSERLCKTLWEHTKSTPQEATAA